jgi:hypothetical protein
MRPSRLRPLSRFARCGRYYTELLQLYKAIGIPFYLSSGDGVSAELPVPHSGSTAACVRVGSLATL